MNIKKNPFRILQSYLSIKLREQKKVFVMLQPYFSMDLREQKKKPIWNSTTYIPVLAQQHTCI